MSKPVAVIDFTGPRTGAFDHVEAGLRHSGSAGQRQDIYFVVHLGAQGKPLSVTFGTGVVDMFGNISDFSRIITLAARCSDGGEHNLIDFKELVTTHDEHFRLFACANCAGVRVDE